MKVLSFGSLNIDFLFYVDHIASAGETISSSALVKSAGGKGANQAAALAKAGLPVYMAGKIGRDGRFLLELLESYGINTDNVFQYEGATGQAIIQIEKSGQNSIVLYSGGNGEITREEIYKTICKFSEGDIIVLQNEIVNLKLIMECAKKQGMRICINPSPFNETVQALPLNLADWLFVNEIEGSSLAQLPCSASPADIDLHITMDHLVKRFPEQEIILTAGKNGSFYGCGDTRIKCEIVNRPVVDTTGAGDTYTGFFLASRARNYNVEKAMAAASKAASLAVSRKGAMESIPMANEVFD